MGVLGLGVCVVWTSRASGRDLQATLWNLAETKYFLGAKDNMPGFQWADLVKLCKYVDEVP